MPNIIYLHQVCLYYRQLKPTVVYALGLNGAGWLIVEELNTQMRSIVEPNGTELMKFDYRRYSEDLKEWEINNRIEYLKRHGYKVCETGA